MKLKMHGLIYYILFGAFRLGIVRGKGGDVNALLVMKFGTGMVLDVFYMMITKNW